MVVEKISSELTPKGSLQKGEMLTLKNRAYMGEIKDTVSFTSTASAAADATERISRMLPHYKAIKNMESLEWLRGEIGTIILTALGTGLVAPIFIGFNPFVRPKKDATPEEKKEVVNTKLYTAMRQPISAVLAILFQAGVQKYIDKFLDSIFNNPERAKYFRANLDQSIINTDSYIKAQVKKDLKDKGIKKPSIFTFKFDKRKQYDRVVKEKVNSVKEEQLKVIANELAQKGTISTAHQQMDSKTVAELVNKQIDEYIKDANSLRKTPEAISHYVQRAETLITNEEYLKSIFKDRPSGEKELEQFVKDLHTRETNPEIKQILKEILDHDVDLRESRIQRTFERIENIKQMCDGSFTKDKYRAKMIARNNILNDRIVRLHELKIKQTAEATPESIKSIINEIAETCHFKKDGSVIEAVLKDTDIFNHELSKLKSKIYKDISKGYKQLVDHHYKSWNQVSKIAVGVLITLPITCTALNWVYPRFMELFFPKLAGVKKAKDEQAQKAGGDK